MARLTPKYCVWLLVFGCAIGAAFDCMGQAHGRPKALLDSSDRARNEGTYEQALHFAVRAGQDARRAKDSSTWAEALVQQGSLRQMLGDISGALIDLHEALRLSEACGAPAVAAGALNAIGAAHSFNNNPGLAKTYYRRSLAIQKRIGSSSDVALLYGNLGSVLEDMGQFDSALYFHRMNLDLRSTAKERSWMAVGYANLGTCFDRMGSYDSARHYLQASLDMLHQPEDGYRRSHVSSALGFTMLHAGQARQAVKMCTGSLALATSLANLPLEERCYDCLYQAQRALGDDASALKALELRNAVRDSLFGVERVKESTRVELLYQFRREQMADSLAREAARQRSEFEFREHIARERDQKRAYLFGAILVLILSIGLWGRLRFMRRSRNLVQKERERSERLLLNILPASVAEELKTHGQARAREVEGVSILFTDFHGFTRIGEKLTAVELVTEVDACFRAFDGITARHGLEKIKTIGDAYMAASGLPTPRPDSAVQAVLAALEMQEWVKQRAQKREAQGLPCFRMRAGIHTGPVVAGIVGITKFQYDVWGDTVNTAAHMESSGEVGEVNISAATYAQVKDMPGLQFVCRGALPAKGKGDLVMYFVSKAAQDDAVSRGRVGT